MQKGIFPEIFRLTFEETVPFQENSEWFADHLERSDLMNQYQYFNSFHDQHANSTSITHFNRHRKCVTANLSGLPVSTCYETFNTGVRSRVFGSLQYLVKK